jgi:DNA-binding MarR family transcriptional regulator
MRTEKLEARSRASATVARMFLECLQAMMGDFEHTNVSAVLPELLIAMVIRLNDERGRPAISLSQITRETGISRRTVQRHVDRLVKRGVVIRKDDGVSGNDAYLETRIDAEYFRRIVRAIRTAARLLEDFK